MHITFQEIQKLMELFVSLNLDEMNLEVEGMRMHMRRNGSSTQMVTTPFFEDRTVKKEVPSLPVLVEDVVHKQIEQKEKAIQKTITSPMVGTFYRAAGPHETPFVQKGDRIQKGQKVCIIEAMKLFNEVESDFEGIIAEILIEDKSSVEFGQPLFILDLL